MPGNGCASLLPLRRPNQVFKKNCYKCESGWCIEHEVDLDRLGALKYLLSRAENLDDKGPEGEGWQSDEYLAGLTALRTVIADLEGKTNDR